MDRFLFDFWLKQMLKQTGRQTKFKLLHDNTMNNIVSPLKRDFFNKKKKKNRNRSTHLKVLAEQRLKKYFDVAL